MFSLFPSRSDPTLQEIVYKLVPGLFKNEMKRRSEFYVKNPETAKLLALTGEEKGDISGERIIYSADDIIPLSIEYHPEVITYSYLPLDASSSDKGPSRKLPLPQTIMDSTIPNKDQLSQKRYLRCPAGVRVHHLKKLLRNKYELKYHHDVEIFYKHDPLIEDYSIVDLAYIYSWRRVGFVLEF